MNLHTRPLSRKELQELRGIVSWQAAGGRAVLFFVLVCLAGAMFRSINHLSPGLVWWPIPVAVIVILMAIYAKRLTGGAALRREIRRDIDAGIVEEHEFSLSTAAVFQEVEDEGPVWLWPDGHQTLRLSGQQLSRISKNGLPRRRLTVTVTPKARRLLHVQCEGEHPELLIAREPFHKCPLFFDKKLTRFYEPHDVAWQKVVDYVKMTNEPTRQP